MFKMWRKSSTNFTIPRLWHPGFAEWLFAVGSIICWAFVYGLFCGYWTTNRATKKEVNETLFTLLSLQTFIFSLLQVRKNTNVDVIEFEKFLCHCEALDLVVVRCSFQTAKIRLLLIQRFIALSQHLFASLQRSAKVFVCGCQKFVPALAYLFCLALPRSCLGKFAYFLADLCT